MMPTYPGRQAQQVPTPGRGRQPGPGGPMMQGTPQPPGYHLPPHAQQQQQQQQAAQQQQQQQQQAQRDRQRESEQMELQKAKERSKIPTDRSLPHGIDDLVIGDGSQQYNALREAERKLDSTMMRKRLDITDSVQRRPKRYGTMRIWITNTVENQPWQQTSGIDHDAFDFGSNVEATYRVKITGKLLSEQDSTDSTPSAEEQTQDTAAGATEAAAKRARMSGPAKTKLSHFFRAITTEFDRPSQFQPDNFNVIEWRRGDAAQQAEFDCLEFERKGDENINVSVNLVRDEEPQRYKLDEPLARMLDMEEADRQTVLMAIWEYVKIAGLQHDPDSRSVRCDKAMHDVFGSDQVYFPNLPRLIENHMVDQPPLRLPYTIRVDKAFHSGPDDSKHTVYDVPVPLEDALQKQMLAIIDSPDHATALEKIADCDRQIALVVQKMHHVKAKHDFFTAMSRDPVSFIKRWTSSQKRDMDVIHGAGAWGDEDWQGAEWRRGGAAGPWGSTEAIEGIGSYLSRQDVLRAHAAATAQTTTTTTSSSARAS